MNSFALPQPRNPGSDMGVGVPTQVSKGTRFGTVDMTKSVRCSHAEL